MCSHIQIFSSYHRLAERPVPCGQLFCWYIPDLLIAVLRGWFPCLELDLHHPRRAWPHHLQISLFQKDQLGTGESHNCSKVQYIYKTLQWSKQHVSPNVCFYHHIIAILPNTWILDILHPPTTDLCQWLYSMFHSDYATKTQLYSNKLNEASETKETPFLTRWKNLFMEPNTYHSSNGNTVYVPTVLVKHHHKPINTCREMNVRDIWKSASHAFMCERKALPSPWPSCAPLTRPAISTTFKNAGTRLDKNKIQDIHAIIPYKLDSTLHPK